MSKNKERRRLLARQEVRADLARQWVNGKTLKQIAAEWGYKTTSDIHYMIFHFSSDWDIYYDYRCIIEDCGYSQKYKDIARRAVSYYDSD
jgi:hypothetical protein